MFAFILLAAQALFSQSYLVTAHVLPRQVAGVSPGPPPGYSVGFSTVCRLISSPSFSRHLAYFIQSLIHPHRKQQDDENPGQLSSCTTSCPSSSFIKTTSTTVRAGTYSAAINTQFGGGSGDCASCGSCYNIINAGVPFCNPSPYDPSCGAPSGSLVQGGPNNITVMITNHCEDCPLVSPSSTSVKITIAFLGALGLVEYVG